MNFYTFNKNLYQFYFKHKRFLQWREHINGYHILVSEMMLQQTQVSRVIPFFDRFISNFPTIYDLAEAKLEDVLANWSGLGYNRRAIFLQEAAKIIVKNYNGTIPQNYEELRKIKGIGDYTAKAIVTYTYNISLSFVETNIRSVFFILFNQYFNDIQENSKEKKINDDFIIEKIKRYIDIKNPRQWYYALMDFGSMLKKKYNNKHIQKSKSFTIQSNFDLSKRKIRGLIIKIILKYKKIELNHLINTVKESEINKNISIIDCITDLIKENFLYIINHNYSEKFILDYKKNNILIKIKEGNS